MVLIDTHTHIYLDAFDTDRAAMLQRARQAGVSRFYLPAIDSQSIERQLQLEAAEPDCIAMPGLHPCSVQANYQQELQITEQWLSKRSWPAIGEIGLDFHWDTSFEKEQYEAFHTQIQWALQYNLPIVIHTRKAMQSTIGVVQQYTSRGLRGIFHCFGGSVAEAQKIIEAGFLLGIGGVATYPKRGLAQTLAQIPLQHLVLETDAPYLSPVPHRGRRNEPAYLNYVVQTLAGIYKTTPQQVAHHTTLNAQQLFAY